MFSIEQGSHEKPFAQTYRCYPISFIEKPLVETGDKVLMPPSALQHLASSHIDCPMLFELRNDAAERVSHCGVLEFTAEEGMIYMPYWMMENLLLQVGDDVKVQDVSLPKGTYIKLQPTMDFLDIPNPKAVLESTLRQYSCLTVGDNIMVEHNDRRYYIDILETKPSNAISLTETECELDFAFPMNCAEPEPVTPSTKLPNEDSSSQSTRKADDTASQSVLNPLIPHLAGCSSVQALDKQTMDTDDLFDYLEPDPSSIDELCGDVRVIRELADAAAMEEHVQDVCAAMETVAKGLSLGLAIFNQQDELQSLKNALDIITKYGNIKTMTKAQHFSAQLLKSKLSELEVCYSAGATAAATYAEHSAKLSSAQGQLSSFLEEGRSLKIAMAEERAVIARLEAELNALRAKHFKNEEKARSIKASVQDHQNVINQLKPQTSQLKVAGEAGQHSCKQVEMELKQFHDVLCVRPNQ